ncbi:uncharacterized protein Dmoj_GI26165, isoform B [Drosophila mojavensis]|uniref:Uncharacterized protein, isoform B n=1 Tax=Drosophila mojavensis TaxID=7230 RepID=A0A0Q9XDV5_DROMO|nr:uncharacterized protein Dmoj_GI26165, isoform B [Drosophila mojavensis]
MALRFLNRFGCCIIRVPCAINFPACNPMFNMQCLCERLSFQNCFKNTYGKENRVPKRIGRKARLCQIRMEQGWTV